MKTYLFEDLPNEIQKELAQKRYDSNVNSFGDFIDDEWYGWFIKECFDKGFIVQVDDISWRGFYSQGDGASFIGKIYYQKYIKFKQLIDLTQEEQTYMNNHNEDTIDIQRNSSNYVHENTCSIVNNGEFPLSDRIKEMMENTRVDLCEILYKYLNAYYDEITDENLIRQQFIEEKHWWDLEGNNYISKPYPIHDYSITLNAKLIKDNLISVDRIGKIGEIHAKRIFIMNAMEELDPEVKAHLIALKSFADEIKKMEFEIQEAWGFNKDVNYHTWWFQLPHCRCPIIDNQDKIGTKYSCVLSECPLHGSKFKPTKLTLLKE